MQNEIRISVRLGSNDRILTRDDRAFYLCNESRREESALTRIEEIPFSEICSVAFEPFVYETKRDVTYGNITLTQSAALFENLPQSISSAIPQTMEDLDQDFGYLVHSTTLRGSFEPLKLEYGKVHDRAIIFLNGKRMGLWERSRVHDEITLSLAAGETARLDILLENMGRVNYGPKLFDRKGILDGIRLGQRFHFGWDQYCLPMEDLSGLQWQPATAWNGQPTFLKGELQIIETPADTFLRLDGFTKGFVTVNGFNIGRYFNSAGPQRTLYAPAPLLKEGSNEIIVFETDGFEKPVITFQDAPDLG
jgi:beta-galactosidase